MVPAEGTRTDIGREKKSVARMREEGTGLREERVEGERRDCGLGVKYRQCRGDREKDKKHILNIYF